LAGGGFCFPGVFYLFSLSEKIILKRKMVEKFSARGGSALGGKNKYTIQSSRLQKYDYSQNGMYFVTR